MRDIFLIIIMDEVIYKFLAFPQIYECIWQDTQELITSLTKINKLNCNFPVSKSDEDIMYIFIYIYIYIKRGELG